MPDRFLVTGASGFLGSHLIEQMRAEGLDFRCLVRDKPVEGASAAEQVRGSLEDEASLREAVRGCSTVIHCAGATHAKDAGRLWEVNGAGTRRLLEVAAAAGVLRFVLVSSLAAQGPSETARPRALDSEPSPVSDYGRSKLEGERQALLYTGRMQIVIVRPPAVYGPRDLNILPFFRAANWSLLPVLGDGSSMASLVYATDAATAIRLCATGPAPRSGAIYTISDGGQYSWIEIGQSIAASLGHRGRVLRLPLGLVELAARASRLWGRFRGQNTIFGPDKVLELRQKYWICDNAAIQADLGFEPKVSLTEGLHLTIDWYRAHGLL